jgi:L,D-transpeptidase catalytic domain
MKHCLALFVAALLLWSGVPAHAQAWRGIQLDPRGLIRPQLLQSALVAYQQHESSHLSDRNMAIVDFSKPSSQRRLYLVDLVSGDVTSFLVAHGRGSDLDHDAIADMFSDAMGSHASSLGAFRAAVRYQGQHGLSLALDGLDPSNRSARERAVVVHSQWYVSDSMLAKQGRLGRSWGCFVVDPAVIESLVRHLEGGGFLYAGR